MRLLTVTDIATPERSAIVDVDTIAPVIGHWLASDGMTGEPSSNVAALVRAIRKADWSTVHELADYLLVSVEVLA